MVKDKKLQKIKSVVESIFPEGRIILFGSRAKGSFHTQSDYDILVIIKQNLSIKEKRKYACMIRKITAENAIDADVIIKTEKDVDYYKDKIGSVTREALLEGLSL